MAISFIKTKKRAFIIDTVASSLRERLSIIYGRSIYLYAHLVITDSNPKGTMTYTDYYSDTPVNICNKEDIIEQRPLNEVEQDIYERLTSHRKLIKANREYLKQNFYSVIDSTTKKSDEVAEKVKTDTSNPE